MSPTQETAIQSVDRDVFTPWQEYFFQQRPENPWLVSDELRCRWRELAENGCWWGGLGLFRCANSGLEDLTVAQKAMAEFPRHLDLAPLVGLLIDGYLPPPMLYQAFFLPNFVRHARPSPQIWELLGRLLRHPACRDLPMAGDGPYADFLTVNWLLNPARPFSEEYRQFKSEWLLAVVRMRWPEQFDWARATPLEWVGLACTPLWDQYASAGEPPTEVEIWRDAVATDYPANWLAPTSTEIEAWSGPGLLRALTRYRCPRLVWPWLREFEEDLREPLNYLSYLLHGRAKMDAGQYPVLRSEWGRFVRRYSAP